MPIYEYQCRNCEHSLDALQKISDDPLTDCPECGESRLKRLISAPRFRLKGSGWYETDFKTGEKRNLATGDSEKSVKKTDKESDGKSESTQKKSDKKTTDGDGKAA